MGLYIVEHKDRPDGFALRQEVRPKHLAYADALGNTLRLGGPFLDEKDRMIGSLLIIEAGSLSEAEAIVSADPYVMSGLFVESSIRPWRATIDNMKAR